MTRARDGSPSVATLERPSNAAHDRLQVLVAETDGLARSMMRFALRDSDRIAVVHTAGNSREALEIARYYRLSVAIVDAALPPGGGLELVHKLAQSAPNIRVLTVSDNDHRTAIAALRAGAVGHISKDIDPEDLGELVRRAADGEIIVSQPLMPSLLEALREVPASGWRPLRSKLTNREWEVVELLAEGASTQRIAEELVLSPVTIYSHIKSVLRKLGVRSRREAVVAAERLRREEALSRSAT
jgi:DNA-binding NarL/FixJ family response regulator